MFIDMGPLSRPKICLPSRLGVRHRHGARTIGTKVELPKHGAGPPKACFKGPEPGGIEFAALGAGISGVIALLELVDRRLVAALSLADAWAECHPQQRDGTVMLH